MTETEMRERDAWIAEHVMGWPKSRIYEKYAYYDADGNSTGYCVHPPPPAWSGCDNNYWCPTVLKKPAFEVLEKCSYGNRVEVTYNNHKWHVVCEHRKIKVKSKTLELAICEFAFQLFQKKDSK